MSVLIQFLSISYGKEIVGNLKELLLQHIIMVSVVSVSFFFTSPILIPEEKISRKIISFILFSN